MLPEVDRGRYLSSNHTQTTYSDTELATYTVSLNRLALWYEGETTRVARPGNRTSGPGVAVRRANYSTIAPHQWINKEQGSRKLKL